MKNIYLSLIAFLTFFSACQQETFIEENNILASRALNESNTFTFFDSYIVWNGDNYMLDYAILAQNNPTLDANITISYRVTANTGATKTYSFVINAGSTEYGEEGTTLGETIITDMGLDRYQHYITSVEILPILYNGSMSIVGLNNLTSYPWPESSPSTGTIQTLEAEWTKGSYNIGGELKELNYFNAEGGMSRSYTMISKGHFIMEVILYNGSNTDKTYPASEFAIQHYLWDADSYSKYTQMYLVNSASASPISSITIPANSSRTVYFFTNELFYEGNGSFDYDTTPPYHIQLVYDGEVICGDDINLEYQNAYTEGWY